MRIIYNGADIYGDISVNRCCHDMYADSHTDTLFLRFNDNRRLWDGWSPEKEETIEVEDGSARTGKMFIRSIAPENGLYTLRADSTPLSMWDKNNKSWEKVRLLQLGGEIAGRHGLSFEPFSVSDQVYEYVQQNNLPDVLFLRQRCILEGAAFLVYDGRLILYDEAAMEAQATNKTIGVTPAGTFEYRDNAAQSFGRSEVVNGYVTGTYQAPGGSSKTLRRILTVQISSQAEGDRFAKGALRYENKNAASGILWTEIMRDLAAGSVVSLQTVGAASWDGTVFIHHIRHDYALRRSKIFFRKPLEGY